ncbi:MAG TPA: DUF4235 domain-containing protein [Mycobacterium sp.]|nr:DUF4235 domain-containing protein [Mycobacterium sp.]
MSAMTKAVYKPLQIGISVLGGLLAGAVFNQIWKRVGEEPETPDPKDLEQSTGQVLLAAALQGLVFGVVKAVVDRAGARGYHAVIHENPEG